MCIGTRWFIFIYFLIIKKENPFFMVHFFFHFPSFLLLGLCVLSFSGKREVYEIFNNLQKADIKKYKLWKLCKFNKKKMLKRKWKKKKNLNFSMEQKNFISECNCFFFCVCTVSVAIYEPAAWRHRFPFKDLRRKVVFVWK